MSDDIDYAYLLMPLKWVIANPKIKFEADNNSCRYFKRMKVYFNIFRQAINNKNFEMFSDAFAKLLREEDSFCDMFLYSFLNAMNEENIMEVIFDKKDTLDNRTFVNFCNATKEVRKFKTYMKQNPPSCCSH
jgi:hypothetical protein